MCKFDLVVKIIAPKREHVYKKNLTGFENLLGLNLHVILLLLTRFLHRIGFSRSFRLSLRV